MERLIELGTAVAAGGTLSALVSMVATRRRTRAEARSVQVRGELAIVDTATSLVETLRGEIDRVSHRVKTLEGENRQMRVELVRMTAELGRLRVENATLARDRDRLASRLGTREDGGER